ncbi:MAG: SGNH hydrolase domain-containing protein, partial [Solirubrobacteraceae bacterium]|nr:SGNH hydrolase domain-containing protein [Solirubrobacteraceae bacterium]
MALVIAAAFVFAGAATAQRAVTVDPPAATTAPPSATTAPPVATTVQPTDPSTATATQRLTGTAAMRCFGAASRDPRKRCTNRSLRRVVEPTPDDAVTEPSEPCTPIRGNPVEACTFGVAAGQARGTIALIGDSHATHWRAALSVVAEDLHLRGISITRSGCAFTLAETRGDGRCGGWSRRVLDWLGRRPDITGVVTSGSTGTRVVAADGLTARGTAIRGIRSVWSELPPAIRDVWVVRDVPHLDWNAAGCVNAALRAHAAPLECGRPRLEALPTDFSAVAHRLGAPARVHLLDLTSFMCDARRCLSVVGGALV